MNWTRRIFVRETLKGWLGLVVAPAAYSALRVILLSKKSGPMQPSDAGSAEDLARGVGKTVSVGDKRILVARGLQGELHAVSGICTHLGCSIRFEPGRGSGEFACNCHESRFTLSGENISGLATRPLTEYEVMETKGRVIVSEKSVGQVLS